MKHKIFTLALIVNLIGAAAFAQPTIKAQKTAGGSSPDQLQSMWLTKDGGLIVGGFSQSNKSGEKTENNRGPFLTQDYWVVKFDKLGNIQWDKTIGGNSDDYLSSLQQTSNGGYILGGYSHSGISGEKTENSRGEYDYWVVKLDGSGKIQWDKTIGGNSFDYMYSLQQTADGGYILGGHSASNISSEKTQNSRGGHDYWVVKLDSLGKIQWDKTIGGNSFDYLYSLQQTADGGYILGGHSASNISGEKTEKRRGNAGISDFWIVKLDSNGNIQWDKTIGGNDFDQFTSLQQTCDGGYILGGGSSSNTSGEKTENSRGSYDNWIVKLDSVANIQWDKTIGGSETDWLYSLQQTSEGGYILGGYSFSDISGEKTENDKGGGDYWVIKLDSLHNIEWDKSIGGSNIDELTTIKEVEKNRYVLGGYSESGISGDKTDTSRGGYDYWLVVLINKTGGNVITGISQSKNITAKLNKSKNNSFVFYPNPAKDILHIQTNGKATVSLINQSGKVFITKVIINKGEINIAHLPAGLYYVKNITTGEKQKVIVVK